jgi:hypothetical protein
VSCLGAFVGVNIKRRRCDRWAPKNVVGGERPTFEASRVWREHLAAQAFGGGNADMHGFSLVQFPPLWVIQQWSSRPPALEPSWFGS